MEKIRFFLPFRKHGYETRTDMLANALSKLEGENDSVLVDSTNDIRVIRRILSRNRMLKYEIHQRKRTQGGWLIFVIKK